MGDLPETQVLTSSPWNNIWLLLGALLFTAGGVWLIIDEGSVMSWFTTLLFGLCAIVFVIQMVKPETMTLGRDGFTYTLLHHKHTYAWDEVGAFNTVTMKRHIFFTSESVWFSRVQGHLIDGEPHGNIVLDSAIQIPDTYRMDAAAFADLMNAFRNRALGTSSSTMHFTV